MLAPLVVQAAWTAATPLRQLQMLAIQEVAVVVPILCLPAPHGTHVASATLFVEGTKYRFSGHVIFLTRQDVQASVPALNLSAPHGVQVASAVLSAEFAK